jgi:hypothetical protein
MSGDGKRLIVSERKVFATPFCLCECAAKNYRMPISLSSHLGVVGPDKEKPQAAATTWGREPEESAPPRRYRKCPFCQPKCKSKHSVVIKT